MINKKSYLVILVLIILSILMIAFIPNYSYGINKETMIIKTIAKNPIDDPDSYKPNLISNEDAKPITNKANQIIGAIVTVGVAVSVVTLAILGIKYMLGSLEEKAEYQKSMIPYLIGAVLLFSTSTIVGIIAKLFTNINV